MLSLTENTLKLSLPSRASEVIFDSEVHFVSEVSPDGEVWANLTSLVRSTNFTETGFPEAKDELWGFAVQLHFCDSKNITGRKRDQIGKLARNGLSFC